MEFSVGGWVMKVDDGGGRRVCVWHSPLFSYRLFRMPDRVLRSMAFNKSQHLCRGIPLPSPYTDLAVVSPFMPLFTVHLLAIATTKKWWKEMMENHALQKTELPKKITSHFFTQVSCHFPWGLRKKENTVSKVKKKNWSWEQLHFKKMKEKGRGRDKEKEGRAREIPDSSHLLPSQVLNKCETVLPKHFC